jgi:hypothetical protein
MIHHSSGSTLSIDNKDLFGTKLSDTFPCVAPYRALIPVTHEPMYKSDDQNERQRNGTDHNCHNKPNEKLDSRNKVLNFRNSKSRFLFFFPFLLLFWVKSIQDKPTRRNTNHDVGLKQGHRISYKQCPDKKHQRHNHDLPIWNELLHDFTYSWSLPLFFFRY